MLGNRDGLLEFRTTKATSREQIGPKLRFEHLSASQEKQTRIEESVKRCNNRVFKMYNMHQQQPLCAKSGSRFGVQHAATIISLCQKQKQIGNPTQQTQTDNLETWFYLLKPARIVCRNIPHEAQDTVHKTANIYLHIYGDTITRAR